MKTAFLKKSINGLALIAAIFLSMTVSCQKQETDLVPPSSERNFSTWAEVFESYWRAMNYNYVFWDIDETDWDKVYETYYPRFEALGTYSMSTFEEAGALFDELSANLVDHHYTFMLKSTEYNYYVQPSGKEIATRDYYHERMDLQQLVDNATAGVGSGRIVSFEGAVSEVNGSNMLAMSYLIDDVAYIYFSNFYWTYLMLYSADLENDPLYKVYENFFNLIDNTPGLKGVIIDVRNNGGGYINDAYYFYSKMMGESVQPMWTRTKNGLGRYDYGPWVPYIVDPAADSRNLQVPIVQIVDLYSVSMSEMSSLIVKELHNGVVVGERTYGGLGMLMGDFDYSYAGEVENASYWIYTTTTMSKDLHGNRLEGVGVIPDIEVLFDEAAFMSGNDVQLEAALDYIESAMR